MTNATTLKTNTDSEEEEEYNPFGFFPVSPPPRKIMVRAIRAIMAIRVNPNPNRSPNKFSWGRTNRKEPPFVL